MIFKERIFICKADHVSKHWAWNDEQSMRCRTRGCKLKAFRALKGSTRFAQNSQPFVYYENPKTGKLWVAATNNDPRRPRGYTVKREVRTMREYERFRRSQSERSNAEAQLDHEQAKAFNAELAAQSRDNLRQLMSSLSPAGRELARVAIERSYQDTSQAPREECMIQGIELDRSNRQSYHDQSTGWKRRD